jgi:hypothetical protein
MSITDGEFRETGAKQNGSEMGRVRVIGIEQRNRVCVEVSERSADSIQRLLVS